MDCDYTTSFKFEVLSISGSTSSFSFFFFWEYCFYSPWFLLGQICGNNRNFFQILFCFQHLPLFHISSDPCICVFLFFLFLLILFLIPFFWSVHSEFLCSGRDVLTLFMFLASKVFLDLYFSIWPQTKYQFISFYLFLGLTIFIKNFRSLFFLSLLFRFLVLSLPNRGIQVSRPNCSIWIWLDRIGIWSYVCFLAQSSAVFIFLTLYNCAFSSLFGVRIP